MNTNTRVQTFLLACLACLACLGPAAASDAGPANPASPAWVRPRGLPRGHNGGFKGSGWLCSVAARHR